MNIDADGVVLELTEGLDAPALARHFVAAEAAALPPALVADAELLVSELVTNAVLHGRSAITLRVCVDPPGIGVAVHDGGANPINPAEDGPDSDASSGRGLLIVRALASAWGVTPNDPPPGKTVWFTLDAAAV